MGNFLDIIKTKSAAETLKPINQLTATEIEFILTLIKMSSFKGEYLDTVYSTVIKLQEQYTQLNDKK